MKTATWYSPYWVAPMIVALLVVADGCRNSQSADSLVSSNRMVIERGSGHTATLLSDGRVLVVGGARTDEGASSAEQFDPVTGNWSLAGQLLTARWGGHTATRLADGRVLVVGGFNGDERDEQSRLASAEIFDPSTGNWSETGRMTRRITRHTTTLLLDGRVLVVGGYGESTVRESTEWTAEVYDPLKGVWTRVQDLPLGGHHNSHAATLLADGRVLIYGGHGVVVVYNPATNTWAIVRRSPVERSRSSTHRSVRLLDGKVLIVGGYAPVDLTSAQPIDSADLYDPSTGDWTLTNSMRTRRMNHSATLLPDGRVLIAGGSGKAGCHALASVEIYEPRTRKWLNQPDLFIRRSGHQATLLLDGRVLLTGGHDGSYDPSGSECKATAYTELYRLNK